MPSPRLHIRKRVQTPDPRLLSDGRLRSPSPPPPEDATIPRSPSPPLGEEGVIAQVVLMFSIQDPRPDPRGVQFLLHELKGVGLPYHIVFNKIDLVAPEVINEWELRLETWGGCPVSFVSLRNHQGLHELHKVLVGKSSLLLGLHSVGKTSLVNYVTQNRANNDARYDVSTVIKQADKWLVEKCDGSLILKEDHRENPHLRPYCIDLYHDLRSGTEPFLVHPKGWIIKNLLQSDAPALCELVNWVSKMEETEEFLYFMKYCPEEERVWWRKNKVVSSLLKKLVKNKAVASLLKKLEKDYHLKEVMSMLYKACLSPCEEHEEMMKEMLRIVKESPRLCRGLAHGATFVATVVTLMLVGQEPTKMACADLLYILADSYYDCKVIIGELGGFHALSELIRYGSPSARQVGIKTLSVLVGIEDNWRKVLVTGIPESVIGLLVQDGEDALGIASKIFNELGSFELAWNRFFAAAFERLKDIPAVYNVVIQNLLRIKHVQNLKIEYLEGGSLLCERDDDGLI